METIEKQVAVLMQGSDYGDQQIKEMMTKELRQRLTEAAKEGRPLEVYCGYDVTAPDIHLGHTITMHKLRQFQDFGHHVTFVIGTFTTLIGDPSDRDEVRTVPTMEQIEKNAKSYTDQAFKVLDRQKTTVRFNHEWLSKLTFAEVIKMASNFTVQQFLTRDRLRNRYEANKPLWLHELMYPLAMGYDAVHLHADVQIGGSEQLFNLMAGRRLQEAFGLKPQICITFPILVGIDGSEKMSKSLGNYIGVTEPAEQQYGKIMSIPDKLILEYFELLTDISATELADFKQTLANQTVNPMELKKRLAREIVTQLNDKKSADEAEANFERVHQRQELPRDIREHGVSFSGLTSERDGKKFIDMTRLLVETGLAESRSEANRLIAQAGTTLAGETVTTRVIPLEKMDPTGTIVTVGKRRFVKVIDLDIGTLAPARATYPP